MGFSSTFYTVLRSETRAHYRSLKTLPATNHQDAGYDTGSSTLLADSEDLSSRLMPGFSLSLSGFYQHSSEYANRDMLSSSETLGVHGQYLIVWFQQCCYWHPSFRRAETLKHIGERFWDTYHVSVHDSGVCWKDSSALIKAGCASKHMQPSASWKTATARMSHSRLETRRRSPDGPSNKG
jgi:hypothetical protein